MACFNIFSFSEQNVWGDPVASVDEKDEIIIKINPSASQVERDKINSSDDHTTWIATLFRDHQSSVGGFIDHKPQSFYHRAIFGPATDRIEVQGLEIISFRRCIIYLFVQYNHATKQTTIMAYGCDFWISDAASFGTSLDGINEGNLRQYIREAIGNRVGKKNKKKNKKKKNMVEQEITLDPLAIKALKEGSYNLFI